MEAVVERDSKTGRAALVAETARATRLARFGSVASFLSLSLLLAATAAAAREFRLRPDGAGDLPTISAALHAAESGDTLTLVAGRYTGSGNRELSFEGKRLLLRAATSTPDSCILDCEGAGRAFHFREGESGSGRIVGLTITGGVAETGGAVALEGHQGTDFENCVFRGNRATAQGGALWVSYAGTEFTRCLFTGNSAGERGGAVHLCCCSVPRFNNCTFADNSAPVGGAFHIVGMSVPRLHRCIVAFNGPGAAVACGERSREFYPPRIAWTDVFGNEGGDWESCLEGKEAEEGNLCSDPRFVPDGSYRLAADSPARTADGVLGARE